MEVEVPFDIAHIILTYDTLLPLWLRLAHIQALQQNLREDSFLWQKLNFLLHVTYVYYVDTG